MIVKEDFLKKLRAVFDLNIYEVKIWTALLSKGISSAGELSDISNVPRSRAYDILESLEKKGFVLMKIGKPIRYMAVNPKDIIQRVKKHLKEKADEKVNSLEEVKSTQIYDDLVLLHKQGIVNIEPSSLSGAIKGRKHIYNQMETIIREAKNSVSMITTADGFLRKAEFLKPLLKKLKNIKVKIITKETKETKEAAKELNGLASVKFSDALNSRFCIVDGKNLVFAMLHDKDIHENYDIGIWVNTEFFASALQNMFDHTWKNIK
ncbi:MAG: TrmB family transcriptional regulator [Nanoarchaeota archaeon]|nr:TrmB family transcriptional regulator [Nanoarchaeota archaeon]